MSIPPGKKRKPVHKIALFINAADAVVRWRGPQKTGKYLVALKTNLEHQDVWAVAERLRRDPQLARRSLTRLMVVAPFIRREQGAVLERYEIDYVDLVGNAHLRAPGLFVHVEGLRPTSKRPQCHLDNLIPADLDVSDDDSYRRKENREYLRWFRAGLGL